MPAEIIARPHPLRSDAVRAIAPPGSTLAQLLGDVPETVHAQVNGEPWPRERWREPLPEGLVTVHVTPQDDAARAVALIAVAIAAPYAAAAMGLTATAAGVTSLTFAGKLVAAGLTVAGSLAVNALIPPKMPDAPDPSASSSTIRKNITGTRNRANPYGVIPRVYGNPRWFPPLAANPYTEIAGNDQYLRMLVCLGYGPLEVAGNRVGQGHPVLTQATAVGNAIRIGETDIGLFQDVSWEIGMPDQLSLYTRNIDEQQPGVALNKTGAVDNDVWIADTSTATRTTAPDTTRISLDLTFPAGIFSINDNGTNSLTRTEWRIEYRPAGGSTWTQQDQFFADGTRKKTYRLNKAWNVAQGQYEVRVTRLRTYLGGIQAHQTDCTWTALRSIQPGEAYTGNHVLMALRIRATDQLNGVIDQLNLRTQAVLRAWDGAAFSEQATSNPAWSYLDTLTGPQVGRPISDTKVDLANLKDWADWSASQGLEYHWVHDQPETLFNRARTVAAAGQASFSLQDGLFGVVRDDPHAPVVQVISPRNAIGFESSRQYKALPHALRVKYIDPDTWSDSERVVYRDGYDETNATLFEDLETQGVASASEAHHHGQYFFRQAILRPETHRVQMDWENLALVRGNRARLAYDTILVGLGWGRVKAITDTEITLDERVLIDAGVSHGIRVRRQDGTQATVGVSAPASGRTATLTLAEPLTDVSLGDLVLFGELGKESIDCKVTRIEPGADLTADVTLVDAATEIYDFGAAPVFDPGITQAKSIDTLRPSPPALESLRSDETTLVARDDGTFLPGVRVTWTQPSGGVATDRVEIRSSSDSAETWQHLVVPASENSAQVEVTAAGEQMLVQLRARSIYGVWGEWGQQDTITPPSIAGLLLPRAPTSVDVTLGTFTVGLVPAGPYPGQVYEFWRSTAALLESEITTNAVRVAVASSLTDTDLTPNTTYYYYLRGTNAYGVSAWYPVQATTQNDPAKIMAAISGEIRQTDLYADLSANIDGLNSSWVLQVGGDGKVGGIGLAYDDTQQTIDLGILADRFYIADPAGTAADVFPFIVSGGKTIIDEALINSLTFNKLTDAAGTLIVENGKLKAEYIQADQLQVEWANIQNVSIGSADIADLAVTSAKLAGTIQSNNYDPGVAGWRIKKDGTAEFNGVVISRQMEIGSGSHSAGNRSYSENNSLQEKLELWIDTGVSTSAWSGPKETLLARIEQTSGSIFTNLSNPGSTVQWGWQAEVVPITRWSGGATIFLRVRFHARNSCKFESVVLGWHLYKVT